jgi:hypothetical protein
MEQLASLVPQDWSDHNVADPGVTLAEHAAFGLADLHYRMSERRFDAWPLEVHDWQPDAERHWDASLIPGSLSPVANALSSAVTSATVLEPLIRACVSYVDAVALLSKSPWAAAFTAEQRPMVIALMRSRLVREVAQEQAHVIGQAVEAERGTGLPVAARDARAVANLGYALPLWGDEIVAVVRRERRRLTQEALVAQLDVVRAATGVSAPALRVSLAAQDLDPAEVNVAMAAATQPAGLVPENLEDGAGRSQVWPPHPIQALTCEPVTADDYARRARAHADVGRAWAVPGRLEGIAWNGLATGTAAAIVVDEGAPAVTLVVEWAGHKPASPTQAQTDEFLRDVLQQAVGPEVRAPFPDWRANVDELEPRRMVCDEVGVSVLADAPILVQATLVTGVGVDRAAVVTDVRARISAFFTAGRPGSLSAAPSGSVDGPWPLIEQPPGGWIPGDPVRFTEVVSAIVANLEVLGVEKLAMKLDGTASFIPQSVGSLEIPRNAIPLLADANCLKVRFSLTSECGDA